MFKQSRLRSARKADQQLKREALAALDSQLEAEPGLKEHGIREWDFVVGAKSPKGKSLGNGGSGLKGLMHSQSKLPKLKKRVVSSTAEEKN